MDDGLTTLYDPPVFHRIIVSVTDSCPPLAEGTLGLGANGWTTSPPKDIQLMAPHNMAVGEVLEAVIRQHGSLLGPGELVFATKDSRGLRTFQGMVYAGWLMFRPGEVVPKPGEVVKEG